MNSKKRLVELFISPNDFPKYIVGTNEYSIQVARYFNMEGVCFVNEMTSNDSFEGYPVIHNFKDIKENAIVLNSVRIIPIFVKNKLDKAGISNVDIFALIKYTDIPIEVEWWKGFDSFYKSHINEFDNLYEKLTDVISKDTLCRILDWRLNYNLDAMSIFRDNQTNQYFEDFLGLSEQGESFVDVGGFDGNTSLQFIKRCPHYNSIYFFEPGAEMMLVAKNRLSGNDNIVYAEVAASNKKEILHFSSSGSSSKIEDVGDIEVQADTIDNIVNTPVTFMKMDIEGAESMAIEGAKETILKYHPRLAICVYHKIDDFIEIPKQILAIRDDYDLYMRHYTEGMIETVMFFMPRK